MAGQLHHRGWPTEQQQHVVPWGGQMLLDHVSRHKALAVGPVCSTEERREQTLQTHAGKGVGYHIRWGGVNPASSLLRRDQVVAVAGWVYSARFRFTAAPASLPPPSRNRRQKERAQENTTSVRSHLGVWQGHRGGFTEIRSPRGEKALIWRCPERGRVPSGG